MALMMKLRFEIAGNSASKGEVLKKSITPREPQILKLLAEGFVKKHKYLSQSVSSDSLVAV